MEGLPDSRIRTEAGRWSLRAAARLVGVNEKVIRRAERTGRIQACLIGMSGGGCRYQ